MATEFTNNQGLDAVDLLLLLKAAVATVISYHGSFCFLLTDLSALIFCFKGFPFLLLTYK